MLNLSRKHNHIMNAIHTTMTPTTKRIYNFLLLPLLCNRHFISTTTVEYLYIIYFCFHFLIRQEIELGWSLRFKRNDRNSYSLVWSYEALVLMNKANSNTNLSGNNCLAVDGLISIIFNPVSELRSLHYTSI